VDYIFFLRKNIEDINPNPEEIDEYSWVDRNNLKDFLLAKSKKVC